jgi:hypothetical protein
VDSMLMMLAFCSCCCARMEECSKVTSGSYVGTFESAQLGSVGNDDRLLRHGPPPLRDFLFEEPESCQVSGAKVSKAVITQKHHFGRSLCII